MFHSLMQRFNDAVARATRLDRRVRRHLRRVRSDLAPHDWDHDSEECVHCHVPLYAAAGGSFRRCHVGRRYGQLDRRKS